MPSSANEGKDYAAEFIISSNIRTCLDVGPGIGTYASLINKYDYNIDILDCIEIWEPYVKDFHLEDLYDNVYVGDVRSWKNFNYDLIIFGDVLEHMTKLEAVAVWERAKEQARYAIISIPIIHLPQAGFGGNIYEEHVKDDWSTQEVLETFSNIIAYKEFQTVGVFIAKF